VNLGTGMAFEVNSLFAGCACDVGTISGAVGYVVETIESMISVKRKGEQGREKDTGGLG